jgi:hypothetical protein
MELQRAVSLLKYKCGDIESIVDYIFFHSLEFFTPDKIDEELTELKNQEFDYKEGRLKIDWDE